MSAARRVCVVTGSRADYGLLSVLLRQIKSDPAFALQIVATGAHLSPRFGMTVREIEADGFTVDARVEIGVEDDTPLAAAEAAGRAAAGVARELARLAPDLIVFLGDRYEILAAAQAALLLGVPIAHIHGGEITEGAMDDSIRHAITKMAALHFPAAEPYARRIIQMGEDPERVFTVGALGVEAALSLPALPADQLDRDLGLPLRDPVLLVTYHPVTLRKGGEGPAVDALLEALDEFPKARIVITGVNADPGHAAISARFSAYAANKPDRASVHESLGQRRYLSVMRRAAAVIGNSSSGIIEAPALGVPTVNIGDRQKGRLKAPSVIDCGETANGIADAVARAIAPQFHARIAGQAPPYGGGGTAAKIAAVLKGVDLSRLGAKRFHDPAGAA